jgi:HSP20 family protein
MREFNRYHTHIFATMNTPARFEHSTATTWRPLVDIYERADGLLVIVQLPGVDQDRIEVSAEEGRLTIAAVRPERFPEGTVRVHQMEIPSGRFARTIPLPPDADISRIEAGYDEGYLVIEIPKK